MGAFKEDDIVEITGNDNDHGFQTGDKVRLLEWDESESGWECEALTDGETWWVLETNMKEKA